MKFNKCYRLLMKLEVLILTNYNILSHNAFRYIA